jgi:putative ABC transport system permease protein
MIKSFAKLAGVEPGVERDGVLTGHIVLPPAINDGARDVRWPKQRAITERILERVSQLPGVTRVGLINNMPFTTERSASDFTIDGDPIPAAGDNPTSDFRTVGGDYYRAMGMPILEGRVFDPKLDRADTPTVFVVNDAFAKRYFSGRNTVGRRLTFDWFGIVKGEIIGVVGNVRAEGLMKDAEPALYRWYPQDPYGQYSLILSTSVEPETLQAPVARAVRTIDPLMPFSNVHTLEQLISGTIARPRFNATMLSLFAALGLILASIGIYGVLSYSVAQRTHEMGIRMALGADPRDVLRLVVQDGAKVAIIGVAVGVLIAVPATRLLAALLYGVEASDPAVFATVTLTLTAIALVASYIPARRATRVDPMLALRPE